MSTFRTRVIALLQQGTLQEWCRLSLLDLLVLGPAISTTALTRLFIAPLPMTLQGNESATACSSKSKCPRVATFQTFAM